MKRRSYHPRRRRTSTSWGSLIGMLKRLFTKETGIPTGRAGAERRMGRMIIDLITGKKKR